jgi:hypothetical protein
MGDSCSIYQGAFPMCAWSYCGKPRKISVIIFGSSAEIRTWCLELLSFMFSGTHIYHCAVCLLQIFLYAISENR